MAMATGAQLLRCSDLRPSSPPTHPRRTAATTLLSSANTHLRSPLSPLLPPSRSLNFLSLRPRVKHLCAAAASERPKIPSLENLIPNNLLNLTPLTICKWSFIISIATFAAKKTYSLLLNPFFWTYFSWAWIFWPWIFAVAVGIYGLYSLRRHSLDSATVVEQLSIVTSAITWLTVVPAAQFNGFLEGWPIVLFFVYHYFFFFESSVRRRLYGDLYPRRHDPQWDISLPKTSQIAFATLVFAGHWLAAYEGPELHLISGGWGNWVTWGLILIVLFMRYHSVLYLAKYSEKVAVPQAVVQFGPYRWVRHPIYASTMLLFAINCITLRAPLSMLFLVAVCVWYYGRKAELEEALMVETFGDRYIEYANKVRYKLIPFIY